MRTYIDLNCSRRNDRTSVRTAVTEISDLFLIACGAIRSGKIEEIQQAKDELNEFLVDAVDSIDDFNFYADKSCLFALIRDTIAHNQLNINSLGLSILGKGMYYKDQEAHIKFNSYLDWENLAGGRQPVNDSMDIGEYTACARLHKVCRMSKLFYTSEAIARDIRCSARDEFMRTYCQYDMERAMYATGRVAWREFAHKMSQGLSYNDSHNSIHLTHFSKELLGFRSIPGQEITIGSRYSLGSSVMHVIYPTDLYKHYMRCKNNRAERAAIGLRSAEDFANLHNNETALKAFVTAALSFKD